MCITAFPADLKSTIIVVGTRPDGERYIWYSFSVGEPPSLASMLAGLGTRPLIPPKNPRTGTTPTPQPSSLPSAWNPAPVDASSPPIQLPDTWRPGGAGTLYSNFMLWPLFGEFSSITAHDTTTAGSALDDIGQAVSPPISDVLTSFHEIGRSSFMREEVREFDNEVYTTLVSRDPNAIASTLRERKVRFTSPDGGNYDEILRQFAAFYPGAPIPLILIKAGKAVKGSVLLSYRPMAEFEHLYFIPALDGHGKLDLEEFVLRDHRIAVACDSSHGTKVDYQNLTPVAQKLRPYLPSHVTGTGLRGNTPNCDFIFVRDDIDRGQFEGHLVQPYGLGAAGKDLGAMRLRKGGIIAA